MQSASTQAFVNGSQAAAASQVKPGFAISPEDDLAFALGYPRFRYIIDGHPDDEPAELDVWIQRCFRSAHWHQGVGATPRGIAYRQLRVVGCADQGGREPSDELRAALT